MDELEDEGDKFYGVDQEAMKREIANHTKYQDEIQEDLKKNVERMEEKDKKTCCVDLSA